MNLKLRIWRQETPDVDGAMVEYEVRGVSEDSSFLEMLDILNEEAFCSRRGSSRV